MVVVQTLAAGNQRNQADVRGSVVEILVADVVAKPVDRRSEPEDVDGRVQACCEQTPANSQHCAERRRADREPHKTAIEHVLVPPTFVNVACIALHDVGFLDLTHVIKHVAELDLPEADEGRAVRIAFLIGERMVLAMDRHPFPGLLTGGEPEGASRTIVMYLYSYIQNQRYSDATALSVYLFIVLMVLIILFRTFVKEDPDA